MYDTFHKMVCYSQITRISVIVFSLIFMSSKSIFNECFQDFIKLSKSCTKTYSCQKCNMRSQFVFVSDSRFFETLSLLIFALSKNINSFVSILSTNCDTILFFLIENKQGITNTVQEKLCRAKNEKRRTKNALRRAETRKKIKTATSCHMPAYENHKTEERKIQRTRIE